MEKLLARSSNVVFLLSLVACSASQPDYTDSADLSELQSHFRCDAPSSAVEERACAALAGFSSARAVTFPIQSSDMFVGRTDCTSDTGAWIRLEHIELTPNAPSSPRVDSAHRPLGGLHHGYLSIRYSPQAEDAATETVDSLAQRADFLLPEGAGMPPSNVGQWRSLARPTPAPDIAQSDGLSLLHSPGTTPAWWDNANPTPAFVFYRQDGEVLYRVQTPTHAGPAGTHACVTRLFALPPTE